MVELTGTHWRRLATRWITSYQGIKASILLDTYAEGPVICRTNRNDVADDHIELGHPFVETDLEVQWNIRALAVVVVGGTPLNIEDSVRG